jgi:ubiquitin carboxyl-terminal hydrolase 1
VSKAISKLRGLADAASLQCSPKMVDGQEEKRREIDPEAKKKKVRSLAHPWEGLFARRRVCRVCGWCESVRMDTLGGMELPVPLYVSRVSVCR